MGKTRCTRMWAGFATVVAATGVAAGANAVADENGKAGDDAKRPALGATAQAGSRETARDGNEHHPVRVSVEQAKRAARAERSGLDSPEPDAHPVPYSGAGTVEPASKPSGNGDTDASAVR
jgi:hypothetical protein